MVPMALPLVELLILLAAWLSRILDRLKVGWPAQTPASILVGSSSLLVMVVDAAASHCRAVVVWDGDRVECEVVC